MDKNNNSNYGFCSRCGSVLEPVWFTEEEIEIINNSICKTGRKRRACSYLECPICLKKECIDDTFDGRWY